MRRRLPLPRKGTRVLAQQSDAVGGDELALGVGGGRGRSLHVVQLRQQRGEVAAVRQRRPRHRRAVLVKLGLGGILRDVDDLELVAADRIAE